MAGRFPFADPNNPAGNPQRAAMRAALGLPPASLSELSADAAVFAEQQRIEAQQREMRYRQALFENQVEHQIQELQLRNAAAEMDHIPELQQHYANLILRERLARGVEAEQQAAAVVHHQQQQQQAAAAAAYRRQAAAAAAAEQHYAAAAAASVPHPAFPGHPAHAASVQAHAAQLRHQEELRQQQQQQQQQQTAALQAHLRGPSPAMPPGVPPGVPLDQLVLRNAGMAGPQPPHSSSPPQTEAVVAAAAEASVEEPEEAVVAVEQQQQQAPPTELVENTSTDSVEMEDLEENKKQHPDLVPLQGGKKKKAKRRGASEASAKPAAADGADGQDERPEEQEATPKRKRGRPRKESGSATATSKAAKKTKEKVVDEDEQRMRAEAILQAMAERAAGLRFEHENELEQIVAATATVPTETADAHLPPQPHIPQHPHIPPQPHAPQPHIPLQPHIPPHVEQQMQQQQIHLKSPGPPVPASEVMQEDREMPSSNLETLGTLGSLLEAANSQQKAFDVAHVLQGLKGVSFSDFDLSSEEEAKLSKKRPPSYAVDGGLSVPSEPAESIVTSMLQSHFPKLPEEPLYDGQDEDIMESVLMGTGDAMKVDTETNNKAMAEEQAVGATAELKKNSEEKGNNDEPKSNVLDYPYPVDTWWPTTSGRRRERHQNGETSDEDAFEDPKRPEGTELPLLRANGPRIRDRLLTELEPGILEKLPHCRLHRVQRCSVTVSELVYCFQVTECYPKEVMVCCSVCGTWRHACCGGHYETYSMRKNLEEPFVAVCEQCHEEQKILKNHPLADARIERQRVEQTRRALATTAVMRSMSFSKHGGTYKWPLGSVSATHVGGHTRSVQSRHDKAEKQWADLLTRLSRGYGYRTKERQRVRTKELERLLVAIEDAEGQTDRHNMLLFLLRDTKRALPVGFEEENKNLFDPTVPDNEFDSVGFTPSRRTESQQQKKLLPARGDDEEEEDKKERPVCVKEGCHKKARFDSRFCSDACGVHVLEQDLLQAFFESDEIHPSVLRSHY